MSRDGGQTLTRNPFSAGGDNHDIWIDPLNADRILIAHDGGASFTLNGGKSYTRVVLPIAQMYHVHADARVPYYVYGNRQDGSSRSEEHTSELQSQSNLVCRLLLE